MALGVANLSAEEGGGELVGLVADDEVPPTLRRAELGLHVLVARQLVEAGNHEVVFQGTSCR